MAKKRIVKTIICLLLVVFLLIPFFSYGQDLTAGKGITGLLKSQAERATLVASKDNNLVVIVGNIIYTLLGFLGIICLIVIITAGIMWMTAGGNEENVKKAKDIVQAAIMGLIVILAAYAITIFVLNILLTSLGPPARPTDEDIYSEETDVPDNVIIPICCKIMELRDGQYYTFDERFTFEECENHCLGISPSRCQVIKNTCEHAL